MSGPWRAGVLLWALLCLPAPGLAKDGARPAPGAWVIYRLEAPGGHRMFWRLSDFPAARSSRTPAHLVEVELAPAASFEAPLLQLRLETAGAEPLRGARIRRAWLALAGGPARELAPEDLARLEPGGAVGGRGLTISGEPSARCTSLMTAAGTLKTRRFELSRRATVVERLWYAAAVPILHLARVELPALGIRLELEGFGAGAKPHMMVDEGQAPIRLSPEAGRALLPPGIGAAYDATTEETAKNP